jgi:type II secretory pathway component PulC
VFWHVVKRSRIFNRRFFGEDAVYIVRDEFAWVENRIPAEKPKRVSAVTKQEDIKLEGLVVERNRREGK